MNKREFLNTILKVCKTYWNLSIDWSFTSFFFQRERTIKWILLQFTVAKYEEIKKNPSKLELQMNLFKWIFNLSLSFWISFLQKLLSKNESVKWIFIFDFFSPKKSWPKYDDTWTKRIMLNFSFEVSSYSGQAVLSAI